MSIESWIWNDKERLEYCDAMEYLYQEWGNFPMFVPRGGPAKEISPRYYKGWRFMLTGENEIVFASCLVPAITREAYQQFVATMAAEVWK